MNIRKYTNNFTVAQNCKKVTSLLVSSEIFEIGEPSFYYE